MMQGPDGGAAIFSLSQLSFSYLSLSLFLSSCEHSCVSPFSLFLSLCSSLSLASRSFTLLLPAHRLTPAWKIPIISKLVSTRVHWQPEIHQTAIVHFPRSNQYYFSSSDTKRRAFILPRIKPFRVSIADCHARFRGPSISSAHRFLRSLGQVTLSLSLSFCRLTVSNFVNIRTAQ